MTVLEKILYGVRTFFASFVLVFMFFPGLLLMITGTPIKQTAEICFVFNVFLWIAVFVIQYFQEREQKSCDNCKCTSGGN